MATRDPARNTRPKTHQPPAARVTATAMLLGYRRPLRIVWLYVPTDPWAVTLAMSVTRRRWVEWTFCRELLATGLVMPAGRGDVVLRPDGPAVLQIELNSPTGHAEISAAAADAHRFLALTYTQIPLGAEGPIRDEDFHSLLER
jgi:Streptomyces sporulation and cell division protein, SsgA